ncbi:hypothetical protein JCM10207_006745 [Rhodosporidiobolus poonsookiae]
MKPNSLFLAVFLASFAHLAYGGPLAYAICQAGCAAVVVACYSAAGFTFGTVVAGPATPAVLLACNAAQGTCYAACAVSALAPVP